MDDRGRVPLPPRFREPLLRGVILVQGNPDRCVRAFPSDDFDHQAALYMSEPLTSRTGRVMRRSFFSAAYPVELDAQGRVLIPPPLRRWAGLDNQVVVAGVGEAIEIWSATDFEAALEAEDDEFRQTLGDPSGAVGSE